MSNKPIPFRRKKELVLLARYEEGPDLRRIGVVELLKQKGVEVSVDEGHQIARTLDDEGLIELSASQSGDYISLTGYGTEHVEEVLLNPSLLEDSNDTIQAITDFSLTLQKLELGDEILYEEIEDLKQLVGKVPKKSILEILIGKLVSFGLGWLKPEIEKALEAGRNLLN